MYKNLQKQTAWTFILFIFNKVSQNFSNLGDFVDFLDSRFYILQYLTNL